MFDTIAVPLWFLVLIGIFAFLSVLDKILLPSVRWALRRRANRAIDELNQRLSLRIPSFKLTKRQVLIDRLVYDPEVLEAVDQEAADTGAPREVILEKAKRYAREIVPSFSAYAYFRIGTRAARWLSKLLYRVRLGHVDQHALKDIPTNASVVFVMNHRSNMDYVLVTYLAATSSALSYAVGEWARIWGLQSLIRMMGAYFIRRDASNALYRRVLATYVKAATEAGVAQAVFPEGGLTRDGVLRKPKLGILSYIVGGFNPKGDRDIVFVPVGINYDRVLEDRILTQRAKQEAKDPGHAKSAFRFSVSAFLGFVGHHLWLALRGKWFKFGYACVSFGQPVSLRNTVHDQNFVLKDASDDARKAFTEKLGNLLMHRVGEVVPVLPVSLVSAVLLKNADHPVTAFELRGQVYEYMHALQRAGAHVHIPRNDFDYALDVGIRMLITRHLIWHTKLTYQAKPEEHELLSYYANALAHFEISPAPPPKSASDSYSVPVTNS